MTAFLIGSLFPVFAIFLGVKALTPAGIELWDGKKLPRTASVIVGVAALVFSVGAIAFLFAYCVLRMPLL